MEALDRPIIVTFFPTFAAAEKREETVTLRALAPRILTTTSGAKAKLPWLKLARFGDARTTKNSLRHNENVLAISGIEGDYDAEIVSVEEAVSILRAAHLAGAIYTSPSHTEDTPRWRVLCPLSREYPSADRLRFLERLNGVFFGALSNESFTLSQSYYFGSLNRNPSHAVELVDGEYIDLRPDLDDGAIGKPKIDHVPAPHPLPHSTGDKSKFVQAVIGNALAKVSAAPDGQKHHTLRSQARLLGGYHAAGGYSTSEALQWLMDALPATVKDRRAAERTALWGLERGAEKPLEISDSPEWLTRKKSNGHDESPPDWENDPGYWQSVHLDAAPNQQPPPEPDNPDTSVELPIFDPWNTLRPVAFPFDALPPRLGDFVGNRARIIGADPCAIGWACISACSAAIDGRIRLRMKRHDAWSVPPAIWVALIGIPSTKKSPIIDTAWAPLNRIQGLDLAAFERAKATWKSLPKEQRLRTPEPEMRRRLVSHDATMEALQGILAKQDRGIGILRDELAGWIGSLEKYAPGKGGAADRAFALQSYNGVPHVVDRVERGMLPIANLLATICGGIQPDRLRAFGDLTDDGLWQRFVPIITAPAGMGEDEADGRAESYEGMIRRLLVVPAGAKLELAENAHAIREAVLRRVFDLEQSEVLGSRFVGFCGKLGGLWGRLALVLHLIDRSDSPVVSRATAEAAQALLFRSVLPNAARVYTAMGGAGGDVEATQSIAGYILTKKLRRVVMSDLTSNVRVCRHRSAEDVRKLVSPLEAGGWLAAERDFATTAWLVADRVHTKFAVQAEREARRRAAIRALITGTDDPD